MWSCITRAYRENISPSFLPRGKTLWTHFNGAVAFAHLCELEITAFIDDQCSMTGAWIHGNYIPYFSLWIMHSTAPWFMPKDRASWSFVVKKVWSRITSPLDADTIAAMDSKANNEVQARKLPHCYWWPRLVAGIPIGRHILVGGDFHHVHYCHGWQIFCMTKRRHCYGSCWRLVNPISQSRTKTWLQIEHHEEELATSVPYRYPVFCHAVRCLHITEPHNSSPARLCHASPRDLRRATQIQKTSSLIRWRYCTSFDKSVFKRIRSYNDKDSSVEEMRLVIRAKDVLMASQAGVIE